jgi:hypothetical protein
MFIKFLLVAPINLMDFASEVELRDIQIVARANTMSSRILTPQLRFRGEMESLVDSPSPDRLIATLL